VSFIGTENFISAAGADADGVYITQVVPSPYNMALPMIQQYLLDIAPANIGYSSLEGYVNAWVFSEALRKAGPEPTREALVKALKALTVDLGGLQVAFSPTSHQGSNAVFLTRIQGGQALPVQQMQ
jgi:ABC-type branched-subunit amino acid transport system substrate-binding protein